MIIIIAVYLNNWGMIFITLILQAELWLFIVCLHVFVVGPELNEINEKEEIDNSLFPASVRCSCSRALQSL